ncbi:ABC transporter ATP-binding protein [Sulfurimicrobium lacus]|uniref:ABC transporter ATP-binding protein n=1 Tax=Sulfurimicrobium lacus TaxID=2715678 RepID=A0A6F8VED2_9PROT|nr:ABC transporter ATP-binding protein [Sulfurimicrobium lacus]BCB27700.1 ABC transporter ATP-binding protein [Sulfurimicrobium lacus]
MINFNHVSKTFKRNQVLDHIDLNIELGERIALVGSNGAGKTTLIRCLLGEYTYDGEVTVNGLIPRRERSKVLQKIGFVPQLPPPLKMPVGQLVGFAASLCNTERKRMEDVAARLGLDFGKISHLPFVKLSGGMKQKLLIAIAMGRDTSVLVMDEPAANLDPDARHIFFELLAERLENTTMLISSHRLDEVAPLVNRVLEMDRGKVVLDDRVAEDVSLSGKLACRLTLRRSEEAIAKALLGWNFRDMGGGLEWQGNVAGPDRLRFLGMISRYVGVLTSISLDEDKGGEA